MIAAADATGIERDIRGVASDPTPPPKPVLPIPTAITAIAARIQNSTG
jgi:hypothetical protein